MLGCIHEEFGNSLSAHVARFNDGSTEWSLATMTHALPWQTPKTIALVGLMGAGKSSIGRRLGQALGLPFVDADSEIEAAAGASIEEIFARDGEAVFRGGERRVISRLLDGSAQVLATGGGAFMDPITRGLIRERAISVWLRADLETLLVRVGRRNNRPLLKTGDPRAVLTRLIDERYPVYAEADITIDTVDGPPEATLGKVIAALDRFLAVPVHVEAGP
ncbi:MAG TPA: shikimate kinase [Stellaceae bacterium]|jgi:shikimate kinase|nr:shikimate kinase [Stellaceae bacterium]